MKPLPSAVALCAVVALGLAANGCSKKRRSTTSTTSASVTSGSNATTTSGSGASASSQSTGGVTSAATAPTQTQTPTPQPTGLLGGTGVFLDGSARLPDTSLNDFTVASGDVNGDGTVDLVFGEYDGPTRVYLNQLNQVFTVRDGGFPDMDMKSTDIQLVDMNGDKVLDAVVASNFQPVRVFMNDGTGRFSLAGMYPDANVSFTYKVAIGDPNGDGKPDVFLANAGQNTAARGENLLYLNDGTGTLDRAPAGSLPAQFDDTIGALFVDLNGDAKQDLFVANFGVPHRILINDGAGVFTDESATRLPTGLVAAGTAVVAADFNKDGFVDLFVANEGLPGANGSPPPGEANTLLINDGQGRFLDGSARLPADVKATFHVRTFDVDGNGFPDLLLSNLRSEQQLYLNQNGSFTDMTATNYPAVNQTPSDSLGLVVDDFDGNRTADVVYARRGERPFLFLNPAK
ncbi:MAG: VCBS repeat-containing protein [Planctomycetota bacterium]